MIGVGSVVFKPYFWFLSGENRVVLLKDGGCEWSFVVI